MKYLLVLFFGILCLISCQNNPEPKTTDTTGINQPIPAGATLPRNPANENIIKREPEKGSAMMGGKPKGAIIGTNVSLHKDATVKSEKIATFDNKEVVEVLDSKSVTSESQAILSKSIMVKGSGGKVTVPQGKQVAIVDYQSGRSTYMVEYEDPKKGLLTAQVDADIIQTVLFGTYFKVQRNSGETGWVLGKFLKMEQSGN